MHHCRFYRLIMHRFHHRRSNLLSNENTDDWQRITKKPSNQNGTTVLWLRSRAKNALFIWLRDIYSISHVFWRTRLANIDWQRRLWLRSAISDDYYQESFLSFVFSRKSIIEKNRARGRERERKRRQRWLAPNVFFLTERKRIVISHGVRLFVQSQRPLILSRSSAASKSPNNHFCRSQHRIEQYFPHVLINQEIIDGQDRSQWW